MSGTEFRASPSPYLEVKSERTAPFLTKPSSQSMPHAADSNLEGDVIDVAAEVMTE